MTDTNQLPPHTITIHDHPEPHIMQWSNLELAAVKRYAEQYALQARAQVQGEPMAWLHWLNGPVRVFMNKDEAMMELDRLNREYPLDTDDRKMRPLILGDTTQQPTQAAQAVPMTDEREAFESCALMAGSLFKRRADDPDKYWDGNVQDDWELWQARAILALRPERVPDDVVRDAERWRYAIAEGGNQSMNFIDIFDDWDGDGSFVEAFDKARLAAKKASA